MAASSIWCSVAGADIVQVTDLEGNVTQVICVEYEASSGTCRVLRAARTGGPLAQLLESVAEDTLRAPGTQCVLRA